MENITTFNKETGEINFASMTIDKLFKTTTKLLEQSSCENAVHVALSSLFYKFMTGTDTPSRIDSSLGVAWDNINEFPEELIGELTSKPICRGELKYKHEPGEDYICEMFTQLFATVADPELLNNPPIYYFVADKKCITFVHNIEVQKYVERNQDRLKKLTPSNHKHVEFVKLQKEITNTLQGRYKTFNYFDRDDFEELILFIINNLNFKHHQMYLPLKNRC